MRNEFIYQKPRLSALAGHGKNVLQLKGSHSDELKTSARRTTSNQKHTENRVKRRGKITHTFLVEKAVFHFDDGSSELCTFAIAREQ